MPFPYFPFLCLYFVTFYSTIKELNAEQTEYLVLEHASEFRVIFEGKVTSFLAKKCLEFKLDTS